MYDLITKKLYTYLAQLAVRAPPNIYNVVIKLSGVRSPVEAELLWPNNHSMRGNYRGLGLYPWTYAAHELDFSAIHENHVRKNVLSYILFSQLPCFRGFSLFLNRGVLFSRITIKYMTVKKEVLNRGRVIFAGWMPTSKHRENKATAEKTVLQ